MSEGKKIPYAEAHKLARSFIDLFDQFFSRIEIAGSIRRKCDWIGDIEFVGIVKEVNDGLFDYPMPLPLDAMIGRMQAYGYQVKKAGAKYIQFGEHKSLPNIDLFLCTPETWGCIFMIRTGSAKFMQTMVTQRYKHGYCPDDMCFVGGRLLRDGKTLDTPEEEDVFREMGLAFVPPEERSVQ